MQRFAQVHDRPAAARRGSGSSTSMATALHAEPRPARRDWRRRPTASSIAGAETADTWTLGSSRSATPVVPAPGQFACCTRSASARCRSRSAPARARRRARAHDPRRRRRDARARRGRARASRRRPRPVRHDLAARGAAGATSWSWPAASAWRRCGPRSTTRSRTASEFGTVCVLVGARTPADLLFLRRAGGLARALRRRRGRDGRRAPTPDWHGRVGVVTTADPARAVRPRATPSRSCAGPS